MLYELIGEDDCPFDWTGSEPPETLEGGEVFMDLVRTFAYGFNDGKGDLQHALVLAKAHSTLADYFTGDTWQEIGIILLQIIKEHVESHQGCNLSFNFGHESGQRFEHPHFHALVRSGDEPAGHKGLKTLVERFNTLVTGLRSLMSKVDDPEISAQLKELIAAAIWVPSTKP